MGNKGPIYKAYVYQDHKGSNPLLIIIIITIISTPLVSLEEGELLRIPLEC